MREGEKGESTVADCWDGAGERARARATGGATFGLKGRGGALGRMRRRQPFSWPRRASVGLCSRLLASVGRGSPLCWAAAGLCSALRTLRWPPPASPGLPWRANHSPPPASASKSRPAAPASLYPSRPSRPSRPRAPVTLQPPGAACSPPSTHRLHTHPPPPPGRWI